MGKFIVTVVLLFQICMFLLLLTARSTPSGKHSEESNDAFSRKANHSQSDLSKTDILNSESQNIATRDGSTSSKKKSSKSDKGKTIQKTDSFLSKDLLNVDSDERHTDISEEESDDDVVTKTDSFDNELDTEWCD